MWTSDRRRYLSSLTTCRAHKLLILDETVHNALIWTEPTGTVMVVLEELKASEGTNISVTLLFEVYAAHSTYVVYRAVYLSAHLSCGMTCGEQCIWTIQGFPDLPSRLLLRLRHMPF